ncbi:zf-CHCC domain-containing protein [Gammaproteobacteria bacterium]
MHEAHATPTAPGREKTTVPNAQRLFTVTRSDLPIRCPMPGASLWDSHPRVFLAVEKTGQAKCPYCGAEYLLRSE